MVLYAQLKELYVVLLKITRLQKVLQYQKLFSHSCMELNSLNMMRKKLKNGMLN